MRGTPKLHCSFEETSRPGLYILVLFILLNTCSLEDKINELQDQIRISETTEETGT